MANKTIIVIGCSSELVLNAALEAWQMHTKNVELIVVGDKVELPKGIKNIECAFSGRHPEARLLARVARELEADKFIFAYNSYPLAEVKLSEIDKQFANSKNDFATGLPRWYEKEKVLEHYKTFEHNQTKKTFEHSYFANFHQGKTPVLLKDLADKVRLRVLDYGIDKYRIKHLLKHKQFVCVSHAGQMALNELNK